MRSYCSWPRRQARAVSVVGSHRTNGSATAGTRPASDARSTTSDQWASAGPAPPGSPAESQPSRPAHAATKARNRPDSCSLRSERTASGGGRRPMSWSIFHRHRAAGVVVRSGEISEFEPFPAFVRCRSQTSVSADIWPLFLSWHARSDQPSSLGSGCRQRLFIGRVASKARMLKRSSLRSILPSPARPPRGEGRSGYGWPSSVGGDAVLAGLAMLVVLALGSSFRAVNTARSIATESSGWTPSAICESRLH